MVRPTRPEKVRLNLDIHPDQKTKMEELRDRARIESLSEVVRRSVSIYLEIMKANERGEMLYLRGKDGVERQILIL